MLEWREAAIRIGIFQVTGHPAVTVGDIDLLREPIPTESRLRLGSLSPTVPGLREALAETKRTYLEWIANRLETFLEYLRRCNGGPPEILLFPECGLPLAVLPAIRKFSEETGTTVLAGTHSRPLSAEADKLYAQL